MCRWTSPSRRDYRGRPALEQETVRPRQHGASIFRTIPVVLRSASPPEQPSQVFVVSVRLRYPAAGDQTVLRSDPTSLAMQQEHLTKTNTQRRSSRPLRDPSTSTHADPAILSHTSLYPPRRAGRPLPRVPQRPRVARVASPDCPSLGRRRDAASRQAVDGRARRERTWSRDVLEVGEVAEDFSELRGDPFD